MNFVQIGNTAMRVSAIDYVAFQADTLLEEKKYNLDFTVGVGLQRLSSRILDADVEAEITHIVEATGFYQLYRGDQRTFINLANAITVSYVHVSETGTGFTVGFQSGRSEIVRFKNAAKAEMARAAMSAALG